MTALSLRQLVEEAFGEPVLRGANLAARDGAVSRLALLYVLRAFADKIDGPASPRTWIVRASAIDNRALSGFQTFDGAVLRDLDPVAVFGQTDHRENGLYLVRGDAWLRLPGADQPQSLPAGTLVFVAGGPDRGGTLWNLVTPAPIVGSTWLDFAPVRPLSLPLSALDPTGAAPGQVPTADGSGHAVWADQAGDGGDTELQPDIDVTCTAAEVPLSLVYGGAAAARLTDASDPAKMPAWAFVVSKSSDTAGKARREGSLGGFVGLTSGAIYVASNETPGAIIRIDLFVGPGSRQVVGQARSTSILDITIDLDLTEIPAP